MKTCKFLIDYNSNVLMMATNNTFVSCTNITINSLKDTFPYNNFLNLPPYLMQICSKNAHVKHQALVSVL